MRSLLACAVLFIGASQQAACSSMCKEMAADRKAFFSHRAASSAPHATVFVPFSLANRLIARRLAEVQPIGAPIALPGKIGKLIGSVRLAPRRLTLRPAPDDRLGLKLEVAVLAGDRSLLTMTLEADARPEVDPRRGLLEVALRPDDLTSVKPTLGPDSADLLAAEIRSRLPAIAASVLTRDDVRAFSMASLDFLGSQLGTLLVRSGLMTPLGEITRLSVEVPVVPVSRLALRSVGREDGGILIGVFTTLPVGAGVALDPGAIDASEAVQLRLSGDALAELGNWALVRGLVPRRYDEKMRAKEDGEFTPGLRWVAGQRPLKIFAWRVKKPCLRARIGAEPQVAIAGGELVIGIEHGEVEEVQGALLVQARVWMKQIGVDAISFSKKAISSAKISVAGVPIEGTIADAFYRQDVFGIDLIAK